MPWLGFSFAKRPPATKNNGSTSAAAAVDEADEDDFSDEKPQVRMLTEEELSSLQSENAHLKEMLARLQAQQAAAGSSATTAPSQMYPQMHAMPPASNPHAASLSFQRVPDLHSVLSQQGGSAPSAAGTDFYSSLRASLASTATNKPASAATGSIDATASSLEGDADGMDDEWEDSPKRSAASAAATDSLQAPRTEDEAIVHSKHASVVIHKKPLRPRLDDGDEAASKTAAAVVAPKGTDEFDDDFADLPSADAIASGAINAPDLSASLTGEEEAEEVAIFDVAAAEWWMVVPHPDRAGEELASAPVAPLDPAEDEDGFVLVRGKDSSAALGEFIAQLMSRNPEVAKLSPDQLRSMIEQSLIEHGMKDPGTVGRLWQWSKTGYQVYSYASWGYALWADQTVLRMAAACVIKAATWSCILLL